MHKKSALLPDGRTRGNLRLRAQIPKRLRTWFQQEGLFEEGDARQRAETMLLYVIGRRLIRSVASPRARISIKELRAIFRQHRAAKNANPSSAQKWASRQADKIAHLPCIESDGDSIFIPFFEEVHGSDLEIDRWHALADL